MYSRPKLALPRPASTSLNLALAGLLSSALHHYHAHGAGACPVCGRADALDEAWRDRTEHEIARLQAQASVARDARSQANGAKASARELFLPVPAILTGPQVGNADPGPSRVAWAAWVGHPEEDVAAGLRRLADHIEQAWPRLSQPVTELADMAKAELLAREDRWAPVAADVAAWCKRAIEAEAAAQGRRQLAEGRNRRHPQRAHETAG